MHSPLAFHSYLKPLHPNFWHFQFLINIFHDYTTGQRIAFDFLKVTLDLVYGLVAIFFDQEANNIYYGDINFTWSTTLFFITHICLTVEKLPAPSINHLNIRHVIINFGNVLMDGGNVIIFHPEVAYHRMYFCLEWNFENSCSTSSHTTLILHTMTKKSAQVRFNPWMFFLLHFAMQCCVWCKKKNGETYFLTTLVIMNISLDIS